MQKLFLAFFILTISLFPQNKDPDIILQKLIEKFNFVKDYQVDVKIKVDVEFIDAPQTRARIYFKQPDKIHIESERFALMPKDGLNFSPSALLQKKYTSIYEKDDLIDGYKVSVIKIIPLGEGNIILTTLYVDIKENLIRKLETTTKTEGTFSIDLKYKPGSEYPLPAEMIFSFNIERMNIPSALSGETEDESEQKEEKRNKPAKGKVYISYYNYKVNQGIPDEIFNKDKK
jgi:outer membrane lipoprotein-sorting protein